MTRLLIRISLGFLIAVVVVLFSSLAIMHINLVDAYSKHPIPSGVFNLIYRLTDGRSANDPVFQKLEEDFGAAATYRSLESLEIPESIIDAMRRGEIKGYFEPIGERPSAYIRTADDRVIVIGPFDKIEIYSNPWVVGSIICITFALIAATGYVLINPVVARVRRLEQVALEIGRGDLGARSQIDSKDAIGNLSGAFNEMARKLQLMIESQRYLLDAVSHELHTPIARVRFGLEMVRNAQDHTAVEVQVDSIDEDIQEIEGVIAEVLLYNQLGRADVTLNKIEVNVLDVVNRVVENVMRSRMVAAIDVHVDIDPDCAVVVDPTSFGRAIKNVLTNAFKYADSHVAIRARPLGNAIQIEISDDGPGIAKADRIRVFMPFTRLDASRHRASGGVGLGLAIVQRVLALHHGVVRIEESDTGGASVITEWPRLS
ncbi:MAG: hypothetical protein RhofKO_06300 [Rhodothermales bacterium]